MRYAKYHSKKTVVDGIEFDSKKEANRYTELKLLVRAGKIRDLVLQPEYELIPKFKKNGKTYRKTIYRADFSYFDIEANEYVTEDIKSPITKTPVYMLKKKLLLYKYGDINFREVVDGKVERY